MFGLFFDKINNRRKKSEENQKETSPRPTSKNSGVGSTTQGGPRINSLSPTSHNSQQFYFPQYSPQSTSSQNFFKATHDTKKLTQPNISFPKKIDETNTNIITTPTPGNNISKLKTL